MRSSGGERGRARRRAWAHGRTGGGARHSPRPTARPFARRRARRALRRARSPLAVGHVCDRPRARRLVRIGGACRPGRALATSIGDEPVDDEEVDGHNHQRPHGIRLGEQQLPERAQTGHGHAEPAGRLAAAEDGEAGDDTRHAETEDDPAPRTQVTEDEHGVGREEGRLVDGREAFDKGEDPPHGEHHRGEPYPSCSSACTRFHKEPLSIAVVSDWDTRNSARSYTKRILSRRFISHARDGGATACLATVAGTVSYTHLTLPTS